MENQATEFEVQHGERVLEYVLQLNPEASLELQVAALAHDIERSFDKENRPKKEQFLGGYASYKAAHAKRSAEVVAKIIEEFGGFEKDFIDRVSYLVENHEVGGDQDATDLKDADTLAFIKDSMQNPTGAQEPRTINDVKERLDWMFAKISEKNKEIAKPVYEDCLWRLTENLE